jgi:spore coat protein U-like protein
MKLRAALAPLAGLAMSVFCLGNSAQAVTTITSTFQVKIAITSTCIFSTGAASDLDFGTQGVLSTNLSQTSTIMVQCTNTTPYNIGLNGGSVANNVAARQMKSAAGGLVNYALYQDAAHTTNWGNTIGTDTLSAVATGSPVTHTVYGMVPAQTTPAAGAYADTITVTVTY